MKLLAFLFAVAAVAVADSSYLDIFATSPVTFVSDVPGQYGVPVFNQKRFLNLRDVYQGPIVILTPSFGKHQDPRYLHAFIAPQGLSSLSYNRNFQSFYKYLLSLRQISALVFFPGGVGSGFQQYPIDEVTLSDSFRAADFLNLIESNNVAVVYIAPQDVFNSQRFSGLDQLAALNVLQDQIVVTNVYSPNPVNQDGSDSFNLRPQPKGVVVAVAK